MPRKTRVRQPPSLEVALEILGFHAINGIPSPEEVLGAYRALRHAYQREEARFSHARDVLDEIYPIITDGIKGISPIKARR